MKEWRNWAGNVRCEPERWWDPEGEADVAGLLGEAQRLGRKVRIAGSGHSFTPLGETEEWLVRLPRMSGLVKLDEIGRTVTVRAGTTLRELGRRLLERGWAMENLGDIDRQTIGGAVGTGTHGTGNGFGSLSAQVTAIRAVLGNGTIAEVNEEDTGKKRGLFKALQVSFGTIGIMTELTLRIVPAERMRLASFRSTLEETLARLEDFRCGNRHFEFFWFPYSSGTQVKTINPTGAPESKRGRWKEWSAYAVENGLFWGMSEACRIAPRLSGGISRLSARFVPVTDKVGRGPRLFVTPRHVKFMEMEYSVPAAAMRPVLLEMKRLLERRRHSVHFPIECRYVKGDDIWLSPAYGRDSAYIALHMYKGMPYEPYFRDMEQILLAYDGRPHWGKWHSRTASQLAAMYPKWQDAARVREAADPRGVLLNRYVARLISPSAR
ncbi:FAD-binding oxidoreductase [Paenibacillus dendritiformis]|uniref:D-arabinono-1,4-lactone oxidase n=1 Tax=Paenibacillus dendritiformis TaxID=130049 RepID=UPI001B09B97B|nr:D-arabinono-1,4-lactone oxidase [Paenibacillus dendritiformis]GIO72153.1 FAD-binding oxidoreductase [Paenibacillus dendritiformis]